MAKIAIATEKYIIYARFDATGTVEKPDVIGAVFGQTEGLLGNELELRELQKSGRIGRIDVDIDTKTGKSSGIIKIPSSLSKEETALVAAAVATIDRVGPCEAKLKIENVEDVRMEKRQQIMDGAKKILDDMIGSSTESSELSQNIKNDYRVSKITSYGKDKLPAGPEVADSDEVIFVEGRADVLTLLRNGIKNCISVEGTTIPPTVAELSRKKTVTAFVDGDRGGDLIIKDLLQKAKIDFFIKAPDGKEVEELTQKEILQSLRNKKPIADFGKDSDKPERRTYTPRQTGTRSRSPRDTRSPRDSRSRSPSDSRSRSSYSDRPRTPPAPAGSFPEFQPILQKATKYKSAILLDPKKTEIGEVPIKELAKVLADLGTDTKVEVVIVGGTVNQDIVDAAQKIGVKYIAGARRMYSKKSRDLIILGPSDL
ncbi:DNA primase DnaG [Candidatus Undinarchaeota archaeon]